MACDNNIKCPCSYPCVRKGKCCECVQYHLRSGEFPACFFTKETETSFDRSLEALIRDRKG